MVKTEKKIKRKAVDHVGPLVSSEAISQAPSKRRPESPTRNKISFQGSPTWKKISFQEYRKRSTSKKTLEVGPSWKIDNFAPNNKSTPFYMSPNKNENCNKFDAPTTVDNSKPEVVNENLDFENKWEMLPSELPCGIGDILDYSDDEKQEIIYISSDEDDL